MPRWTMAWCFQAKRGFFAVYVGCVYSPLPGLRGTSGAEGTLEVKLHLRLR